MSDSGATQIDAVGKIETRGIDYIPEDERHSTPANLASVWIGAQLTFGVIVIGWLPVAFGLGWWSAFSAITVGLLVGSVPFAFFSLIGPRTGTNSAVSSGAHFGLIGRLVGSFMALFIALGFAALTVWTGGDAVISGAHRLFDTSDGDVARGIAYAAISVVVILVAIYGHANVIAVQKFVILTVGLFLIIGFFALAPDFDSGYKGGAYLLGTFWPTWLLSATVAASLPISYTPFANDYARYISPKRWSDKAVAVTSGVSMFFGLWVALIFAAYMTTIFNDVGTPFVIGLVEIAPKWYVAFLILIGLLGSFAQGGLALYGTGLDTSSIIPRLTRVPATLLISAVTLALVYLGAFVWSAFDTVSAFILLLIVICTPWMMITLIGFLVCQGRYDTADLQLFNLGRRGGAYWYTAGWNPRAVIAFVPAVIVGLMCLTTTLYVGPWANVANGVDVSFISAAVISTVVYGVLVLLVPERNHPKPGEEAKQLSATLGDEPKAGPGAIDSIGTKAAS